MNTLTAYLIPVWVNQTVGDRKTLWVILIPVWEIRLMNFTLLMIPSRSTAFTKGSIDLALIPVMGHRSERTTLSIMWYAHDPTDRLIWSSLICTLSAEIILDHSPKFDHTFSCLALIWTWSLLCINYRIMGGCWLCACCTYVVYINCTLCSTDCRSGVMLCAPIINSIMFM